MAHSIGFSESAYRELKGIKTYWRNKVLSAIEKQLAHQPSVETKNRKCLRAVSPKFEYEPPLWELRVGEFRVFYDVNEEIKTVHIRAIRRKAPEQQTEDIIQ